MTSHIELKDMRFFAYHGVNEQERIVGNHFIISIIISAPLQQAIISDQLEDTISYASVYETIKAEMDIPSRLLEHVAGRIVSSLKKQFPQLTAIDLKLSKLTPPLGGDVHSASVILKETY